MPIVSCITTNKLFNSSSIYFLKAAFLTAIFLWFTVFATLRLEVTFYKTPSFQHASSHRMSGSRNDETLVNLYNFQYVINNMSLCTTSSTGSQSSLLILVIFFENLFKVLTFWIYILFCNFRKNFSNLQQKSFFLNAWKLKLFWRI